LLLFTLSNCRLESSVYGGRHVDALVSELRGDCLQSLAPLPAPDGPTVLQVFELDTTRVKRKLVRSNGGKPTSKRRVEKYSEVGMRSILTVVAVLILSACRPNIVISAPRAGAMPQTIAIEHGTLIDGTGRTPIVDAVILIEGDRIRSVGTQETIRTPRDAEVINARGKFILPGLIDDHCHLEQVGLGDLEELPAEWATPEKMRELILDDARLDLYGGVTTVRDVGSTPLVLDVRQEIESGTFPGPRVIAAGQQLVKKSPTAYMAPSFLEYDGPDDARQKVRHLVALGADLIKVRLTSQRPLPSPEELGTIVAEAHHLHRRVTVHTDVPANQAVQLAIDAGVDGIEHNAPLRADDSVLRQMAAKHIFLGTAGAGGLYVQRYASADPATMVDSQARRVLPPVVVSALDNAALALTQQTARMQSQGWNSEEVQGRFIRGMRRARQVGLLIGFGTDCGSDLMIHGQQYKALYGETQMGSSSMETILMATHDAAKILGRENDLGTVEPGKLADLIILDANPLDDMRNVGKLNAVMKGGKLYRKENASPSPH
jgi:imidazolonepropionase-like amidohydrolase